MGGSKTAVLEKKKILRLRTKAKKKKPEFVRQESWRYDRLKENWRRPKGIDNKMRRKIKGWPPTVNVGYRGPKASRGLHPSGYEEVLVYNVEDLRKVSPKTQAVRIAHTVGEKKRMQILREAKKRKITVLNLREAKEEVKKESIEEEKLEEVKEGEEKEEKVEKIAGKEKSEAKRKRAKKTSEVEEGGQKP